MSKEIDDIFSEAQGFGGYDLEADLIGAGFRVFKPRTTRVGAAKTPERLRTMRAYSRRQWEKTVRTRLQAGKEPTLRRALKVWQRLADEMGIDRSGWRLQ